MARLVSTEQGTVHYEDTVVKPRTRGGKPPERRPRAAICQQVDRIVAEKIRDGANTAISLARQSHSTTLAGKCVEVVRDLYNIAWNVQFGGLAPDKGADIAAKRLNRFAKLCR